MADNIKIIIPIKDANNIKSEIDSVKIDLAKQDQEARENNAKLLKQAAIAIGILLVTCLTASFIISKKFDFAFGSIVKSNLIILIFVALTEFVFLTFVVKNYISADPNHIYHKILKDITSHSPQQ